MSSFFTYYSSPIGLIEIAGTEQAVQTVRFAETYENATSPNPPPNLVQCADQLRDYFAGTLQTFSINVDLLGTAFQQQVWYELTTIPYGKTTSYLALARKFNNPNVVRAIGNTSNKNPICLLLPCHRVIGTDGKLVGYAGGLWRKEWLLEHERKHTGGHQLRLF